VGATQRRYRNEGGMYGKNMWWIRLRGDSTQRREGAKERKEREGKERMKKREKWFEVMF